MHTLCSAVGSALWMSEINLWNVASANIKPVSFILRRETLSCLTCCSADPLQFLPPPLPLSRHLNFSVMCVFPEPKVKTGT